MQQPPQPPARPPPPISYEEYVALCAAEKVWGASGMAGYYRLVPGVWESLKALWEPRIAHNPQQFGSHNGLVEHEARRLQGGGAPRPIGTLQYQSFERQAEQVGSAIGSGVLQGVSALGSALDGLGKQVTGPTVGSRVMVQWSDGNRYPGVVAAVAQGQIQVTMQNGQQHWIPSQYVTPA